MVRAVVSGKSRGARACRLLSLQRKPGRSCVSFLNVELLSRSGFAPAAAAHAARRGALDRGRAARIARAALRLLRRGPHSRCYEYWLVVMLHASPLLLAAALPPLLLAALVSGTAVPPPGPACLAGVPARNQSAPSGPDCPGQLLVHNASCAGEPGSLWQRRANFHPGSECHGENDPNGVMVYKGVYHLFFQDHNPMQLGGHLATTDFVHFKRLSIAIWNDRWYDKAAIWTFSATIVDGAPRIIYPGIAGTNLSNGDCGRASPGEGCFTHSLALPANASDPWLEDWEKPDCNPIVQRVNGTGINAASRDPSTAWRTSRGEWRYMNARADIFSSLDFLDWRWVGNLENFGTGDCPDFYPIPRDCDGCGPAAEDAAGSVSPRPSHVRAGGFKGVYALGVYDEEGQNTTGSWHPLPQYDEFPIDPERELQLALSSLHTRVQSSPVQSSPVHLQLMFSARCVWCLLCCEPV